MNENYYNSLDKPTKIQLINLCLQSLNELHSHTMSWRTLP